MAAVPQNSRALLLSRLGLAAFVIGFITVAIWLASFEMEGALAGFVSRWGYAGYFTAASIAGISIYVPTTHLIFTVPLLNAGLNPWLLAACGAVGATLADGVGYFIGSSGRVVRSETLNLIANRTAVVVSRHPRKAPAILFLWAGFTPLPNEILVIPAGAVGYGVVRTGLITLCGNIVFNVLAVVIALTGS
jgi:membrane protein YqaA with SNARE-associated domain